MAAASDGPASRASRSGARLQAVAVEPVRAAGSCAQRASAIAASAAARSSACGVHRLRVASAATRIARHAASATARILGSPASARSLRVRLVDVRRERQVPARGGLVGGDRLDRLAAQRQSSPAASARAALDDDADRERAEHGERRSAIAMTDARASYEVAAVEQHAREREQADDPAEAVQARDPDVAPRTKSPCTLTCAPSTTRPDGENRWMSGTISSATFAVTRIQPAASRARRPRCRA